MEKKNNFDSCGLLAAVIVLAGILVVIMFTGMWPGQDNGYNSYALQADAWRRGQLDLGQNYEWLELAIFGGKYYVSFPPFPSYILFPFVLIFGLKTPDHWIAIAVALVGAFYACRLCRKYLGSKEKALFFSSFLYLGTGMMFICVNGWVWFIAQNMCVTLSLMSLWYASEGKGGWALSFWACAVGCRPMVALYLPVLLWLLWNNRLSKQGEDTNSLRNTLSRMIKEKGYWCVGPVLIALSYMALNYARFGSVTEFGHNYLPEFTRTTTGQFNLSYFWGNLKNLLRLPSVGEGGGGALQFPTENGMAFWLATPFFITVILAWGSAVWRKMKRAETGRSSLFLLLVLPALALAHVAILCCHRTLGGWHFGNRYLLDLLPYLLLGMLFWQPSKKWFVQWNIPLFAFGAAFNFVGIVATYNHWI